MSAGRAYYITLELSERDFYMPKTSNINITVSPLHGIDPVAGSDKSVPLDGLFALIESSMRNAPENAVRLVSWLRTLAMSSDPTWQDKSIGYVRSCWAFGVFDLATLRRLEGLIQEQSR